MQERDKKINSKKINDFRKKNQKVRRHNNSVKKNKKSVKNLVKIREEIIKENKNNLLIKREGNTADYKTRAYKKRNKTPGQNKGKSETKVNSFKRLKLNQKKSLGPKNKKKSSKSKLKIISGNRLPLTEKPSANYAFFLLASVVSIVLLIIGSIDFLTAESLFLMCIGTLLFKNPKLPSRGIVFDSFALICLLYPLSAFFYCFNIFKAEWRNIGSIYYDIDFGVFNSIVLLESFEAWIILSASLFFFYNLSNWRIDFRGAKRLILFFIIILFIFSLVTIKFGKDPLGSIFSDYFLFIPLSDYLNICYHLYFIGIIFSIGLFVISSKKELIYSFVSFMGVIYYSILLLYYGSYNYLILSLFLSFIFFFIRYLGSKKNSNSYFRLTFLYFLVPATIFVLIGFSLNIEIIWLNDLFLILVDRTSNFLDIFNKLFFDFLFTGNGIATSHNVLPILSAEIPYQNPVGLRRFDLINFTSDFGIVGISGIAAFIICWFQNIIKSKNNILSSAHNIFIVLIVGIILNFILFGININISIIALSLIFFHFTIAKSYCQFSLLKPKSLKIIGCIYIVIGILWLSSSFYKLPIHTDVVYRLGYGKEINANSISEDIFLQRILIDDSYISTKNPNTHFYNAVQGIRSKKPMEDILKSIDNIIFLNPSASDIKLKAGYLLVNVDLDEAILYWENYFRVDPESKIMEFKSLINDYKTDINVLKRLDAIALYSTHFSYYYLMNLDKTNFINFFNSLPEDYLSSKDQIQKFEILKRFLEFGLFELFENYKYSLENSYNDFYILNAIREKEMANFPKAISILRSRIKSYPLKNIEEDVNAKYIPRVFFESYPNYEKGRVLLKRAMLKKDYEYAFDIINHLMNLEYPPLFVYYWKAEILFRMNNLIDSWFAYMTYLEKAKIRHLRNQS